MLLKNPNDPERLKLKSKCSPSHPPPALMASSLIPFPSNVPKSGLFSFFSFLRAEDRYAVRRGQWPVQARSPEAGASVVLLDPGTACPQGSLASLTPVCSDLEDPQCPESRGAV